MYLKGPNSFIQYQATADNTMTLDNQPQIEQAAPSFKFLSKSDVIGVFGFSRSTLYRRVDDGLLPPAVNFGGNYSRWVASEVEAVFRAMVAGKSQGEVTALVVVHVEQRQT